MAYLGRYPAMASGGTVLPDDQTFKGLPATGIDSGSIIQPPIQTIGTGSPAIDPGFNIMGGPGDPGGPVLNNGPGTADSVLYPMGPVQGPNNFVMPRGTLATDLGERLRQAGLNEGVSYGGSEIQYRPDVSAGQRAAVEGIATQPPAPPQISNADVARFIAQQNGGTLPGLPGGGGEGGNPPTVPDVPDETGPSVTGGTGNVSDLSNPPTVTDVNGRGAIASMIDAAVNGINSPFGTAALTTLGIAGAPYGTMAAGGAKLGAAGLGLLGFGGPRANPDVTGTRAEQEAFANAPNQFVGTDPAALAAQRSGERADLTPTPQVDVNGNREDVGPTAPPAVPDITVDSPTGIPDAPPGQANATTAPDTSNAPDNPEGTGGTGAGGAGAPSGGGEGGPGSGAPGDGPYRRGGSVGGRSRPVSGSFKNAKKFSGGGAVPMTRAQRVKSFESKYGNMAV